MGTAGDACRVIDERSTEAADLAREIVRRRAAARSRRWQSPKDLRSRAVVYARGRLDEGATVADVAGELGMVESTLYRWLRVKRADPVPGFRRVAIVPSCGTVGAESDEDPRRVIRLITPHGYVVEGLDAGTVVALLRELG
jgi:transposase-like protein